MKQLGENHTHSELVELGYDYLLKTVKCSFVLKEFPAFLSGEIPDVFGYRNGSPLSIMIECKASRSDFHQNKKKKTLILPETGVGDFRFYLCEPGVIKPDDLPRHWGLLYAKDGKVRQVVGPKGNTWLYGENLDFKQPSNKSAEMSMFATALRRMNIRGLMDNLYGGIPDGM